MSDVSFACAINCMDGRTQGPVIDYLKRKTGAQYIDAVTEPGPIRHLVQGNTEWVDNIKCCCDISVEKHKAKAIAIVGHYDCAGNPQPKDVQVEQIQESVKIVRAWYKTIPIYGVYVNENWQVEEIVSDLGAE